MTRQTDRAGDLPAIAGMPRALSLPSGFGGMSGAARLNAILDMKEPARFVRRLRADEFSYLVFGIGLEEAGCLMPYASAAQRRVLVDMDVWNGSEFLPSKLDEVIEAAKESGLEFATGVLREIDPELVVLSLFKRADFFTVEEADKLEVDPESWFMTPDNVFACICRDPEDVPAVRGLLDLLYAGGVERAHRLIQEGRWDTRDSLEEQAFRYRRSRLADCGFPEEDDPYAIYEPFDLNEFRNRVVSGSDAPSTAGTTPGDTLALTFSGTNSGLYFWRVLASAAPGSIDVPAVMSATLNMVNRVMGARFKDLSDSTALDTSAAHAVALVSVGLESVSGGDVEAAAVVLRRAVPLELYRAGIEVVRPASILARQIIADVGGLVNLSLFQDQAASDIEAAAAFPPSCPPSIRASFGGSGRDFLSCAEAAAAVAMMKRFKAVVQFASAVLGFDPRTRSDVGTVEGLVNAPSFHSVVATAWARQILGHGLSIEPLVASDVAQLRKKAFVGTSVRPELRVSKKNQAHDDADQYSSAVRSFLDEAIDRVEESLGGLNPELPFDVEMIGDCLLVAK